MIQNLLLIDDNDMDNFIAKLLLEKKHITENITVKKSAGEALTYLDELQNSSQGFPEVILLDINMPVMNGFEFLDRFSQYPGKVTEKCCVIILSSSSDPKDIKRAKDFRYVQDYFVKPITTETVKRIEERFMSALNS